jgi:hypothetical protein
MTSLTLTAQVSQVPFGNTEIEGLLFEDGSFGVAIPQVCSIFQFDKIQASRDIKALLGKDFQFDKVRTTLNPKAVNVLQLKDFERLLLKLTIKQNPIAIGMSEDLIGLSLTQLFADAFGLKFEKEDRQAQLKARQQNKLNRLSWTDVIKYYIGTHEVSDSYKQWIYVNVSDALNLAVFGKKAKAMREERGVADDKALRDTFNSKELEQISRLESYASKLVIKFDAEPKQALKEAIEFWS